MNTDGIEEMWVNTRFTGEGLAEFRKVQKQLGIRTRTDVVRYLVHQEAQKYGPRDDAERTEKAG